MKLFAETIGSGPDIVLLHGWGIHSVIWQFVVAELRHDFRVTVIDLPGFGRSSSLDDYSLENVIESILAVAPTTAIWVGWSLGGLIATKITRYHPERVVKLVCVASNPSFLNQNKNWPGIAQSLLEKFADDLSQDYVGTLMRFLLLQFYGHPLDKSMLSWLQANLFQYGKPTMATLLASLQLLKQLDCREDLKCLADKVLFVLGRLDTLVPARLAQALYALLPGVRVTVLPKASHALFLTHQSEFINEIRQFAHE